MGFATNVDTGAIYQVNIPFREFVQTIFLNSSAVTQGYSCVGTHGIDFSAVNNRIYVECLNPSTCVSPYTNASVCTASTWGVDGVSLQVKARLVSPYLSGRYGANFGIQGQVLYYIHAEFCHISHFVCITADSKSRDHVYTGC